MCAYVSGYVSERLTRLNGSEIRIRSSFIDWRWFLISFFVVLFIRSKIGSLSHNEYQTNKMLCAFVILTERNRVFQVKNKCSGILWFMNREKCYLYCVCAIHITHTQNPMQMMMIMMILYCKFHFLCDFFSVWLIVLIFCHYVVLP